MDEFGKALTPEELNQRIILLDALTKSPGWEYFDAMLAQSEMGAYHASINAADAHHMAKAVGGYQAIRDIRSWPQREATLIREQLRITQEARRAHEEQSLLRDD